MASEAVTDLQAPFTADTLLEVRHGKMKNMEGLKIQSGIDKVLCDGPVTINAGGIVGDEHDYTFHGGPDKAVHGYCSAHYPRWQAEFPSAAARFRPGGFGENFVTAHMNEHNVCIGDVVRVGGAGSEDDAETVLLQVSLPRQPCFKLNHRFHLKDFAPNTYRTSRTGWYYRVLRGGKVRAGDQVRLVERPHPGWTIARLQEYMYRVKDDEAANEELAGIEVLGDECRGMFKKRVAVAKKKRERTEKDEKANWKPYKLVKKECQTPRVMSFVFEPVQPEEDPERVGEGAHVKVKLGNGLVRAYSIVSGDRKRFELGIALDENSRGGSRYLHESLDVGDRVEVDAFTSTVPAASAMSHRIFVAAGIGITAFLSLMEGCKEVNFSFILHYAVRSAEDIPFKDRIGELGDSAIIYDKSKGQRLNIGQIIRGMGWNTQLYFCGPTRLMDEALQETKAAGIPEKEVHFEAFEADISGDPFEVVVANRNVALQVKEDETLLEILRKQFDDIPSSCEVGNCGTCKVRVKKGQIDHRGTGLLGEEKSDYMLSCVSRGVGSIEIEV